MHGKTGDGRTGRQTDKLRSIVQMKSESISSQSWCSIPSKKLNIPLYRRWSRVQKYNKNYYYYKYIKYFKKKSAKYLQIG